MNSVEGVAPSSVLETTYATAHTHNRTYVELLTLEALRASSLKFYDILSRLHVLTKQSSNPSDAVSFFLVRIRCL